ncbi:uncharacterized protein TA02760 [Theileria annulata]|uniref:Uncharacterized protein n=1 Tax=Theileria annulata TaxID=5874 RepID=Q4UHM2_THEAN|nr:uncharacterized protein TA02760 [Theileria annulata]CAI73417.1 hypothetical protein TA02760 [Theileria annulata]|eukprot:XP_954094.1 hypothetical protein TA02760 [Theileria annulata]
MELKCIGINNFGKLLKPKTKNEKIKSSNIKIIPYDIYEIWLERNEILLNNNKLQNSNFNKLNNLNLNWRDEIFTEKFRKSLINYSENSIINTLFYYINISNSINTNNTLNSINNTNSINTINTIKDIKNIKDIIKDIEENLDKLLGVDCGIILCCLIKLNIYNNKLIIKLCNKIIQRNEIFSKFSLIYSLQSLVYIINSSNTVLGQTDTVPPPKGISSKVSSKDISSTTSTVGASTVTKGKGANFMPMECTSEKNLNEIAVVTKTGESDTFVDTVDTTGKGANSMVTECTIGNSSNIEETPFGVDGEDTSLGGPHTVTEKYESKKLFIKTLNILIKNLEKFDINLIAQIVNIITKTNININTQLQFISNYINFVTVSGTTETNSPDSNSTTDNTSTLRASTVTEENSTIQIAAPGKGANDTFSTTGKGANFTATECTMGKGANFMPMECTMGKGANSMPMECTTTNNEEAPYGATCAVGASTVTYINSMTIYYLLNGFSRGKLMNKNLFNYMKNIILQNYKNYNINIITSILNSYSKFLYTNRTTVATDSTDHTDTTVHTLTTDHTPITVHTNTTNNMYNNILNKEYLELYCKLADEIIIRSEELNSLHISIISNAYSKILLCHEELFQILLEKFIQLYYTFEPRQIAMFLHSINKLQFQTHHLHYLINTSLKVIY